MSNLEYITREKNEDMHPNNRRTAAPNNGIWDSIFLGCVSARIFLIELSKSRPLIEQCSKENFLV